MKKFLSLLLAAVLVFGLAACGSSNTNNSGNTTPDAPKSIKIGVLVADVSGEEALGFRSYYENYIAKQYPEVTFTYTEQLADAAAEKSAIEKFAAQGYDAILSFSSSDRSVQIETCAQNKLYYAVASGMLDDAQYEQFKANEYFVGQIGPSMDTEYQAGYAMGKYFADKGIKTVGIYGAFIPNPMHVYRTAGLLEGLGCTYGGASGKDAIVGQIFGDQGVNISKIGFGKVEVVGYFQGFGDTTFDEFGAIAAKVPDAFLSVGMATTFFAEALNGAKIQYADIDSFTSGNEKNMKNGSLVYLAGKYSSSVGPIFALLVNAVNGNAVRDNGNALSVSQDYLVATDAASFDKYYAADKGDSPIYSKALLDTVIGKGITAADFVKFVETDRSK